MQARHQRGYVGAASGCPMSKPNFPSAARRHLRDAKRLLGDSPANSFYLAGYVAECSLKAAIEKSPVHAPAFGHRLTSLQDEGFDLAIAMAPALARYRPPLDVVEKVRERWSEKRRYDASDSVKEKEAQEMVELVDTLFRACVVEMFLDGVLEEIPS